LCLARQGNSEVTAHFASEKVANFGVAGTPGSRVRGWIPVNRVPRAHSQPFATLFTTLPNQIATFHRSPAYRRSSLSHPGLSDGILIEKHGQWYVAYIEEIPGVNTQARTLVETRRNLKNLAQWAKPLS
jgi:hypothetical protein